jgi:hypothetical protein
LQGGDWGDGDGGGEGITVRYHGEEARAGCATGDL